jgi:hypothetical protein
MPFDSSEKTERGRGVRIQVIKIESGKPPRVQELLDHILVK